MSLTADSAGEVDLEALRKLLDSRVKLVALTAYPYKWRLGTTGSTGRRAGRGESGIPFFTRCHAVGQGR